MKRYYAALEQKGLAFVPGRTQRGVFPVSFVRGLRGYLVAVAQSPLDVMMLQERAASLHEAVIKGKATPPPPAAGDSFRLTSAEAIDLLLIRNADGIYTPEPSAHRNMLLGGGKILGIFGDEQAAVFSAIQHVRTLDASGMVVCPGIVDMHVHAQGGGGEVRGAPPLVDRASLAPATVVRDPRRLPTSPTSPGARTPASTLALPDPWAALGPWKE